MSNVDAYEPRLGIQHLDPHDAELDHLGTLLSIATEGEAGEYDLIAACARIDPDVLPTVLALACTTITQDRTRANDLLTHGAEANRTLRADVDEYRNQATRYATALATILRTTRDPDTAATCRAALDPDDT